MHANYKSIYGLKQSPRCWNLILDTYLKKNLLKQLVIRVSIIEKQKEYLGVFVDGIILAGKTVKQLEEITRDLY